MFCTKILFYLFYLDVIHLKLIFVYGVNWRSRDLLSQHSCAQHHLRERPFFTLCLTIFTASIINQVCVVLFFQSVSLIRCLVCVFLHQYHNVLVTIANSVTPSAFSSRMYSLFFFFIMRY